MVIYMYLTILIVACIITGIVVTIIERRGFYAKQVAKKPVAIEQPVVQPQPAPVAPVVPQAVQLQPVVQPQPVVAQPVIPQVVVNEDPVVNSPEGPVIVDAVTVMNMQPIQVEEPVATDNYDVPVLLSSYTVDLSDVVQNVQRLEISQPVIEDNMISSVHQVGDYYESH